MQFDINQILTVITIVGTICGAMTVYLRTVLTKQSLDIQSAIRLEFDTRFITRELIDEKLKNLDMRLERIENKIGSNGDHN